MKREIRGCRLWRRDGSFSENASVLFEGEKILSVAGEGEKLPGSADEVIDARGLTLLPGLVDVHTHGCAGWDFCNASEENLQKMKADYRKHGVTSVFPTLASATKEEWLAAIGRIQRVGFEGIHLEGRYLNPAKRGAHAPELLLPPDAADLESVLREIRVPCHVSAAFELDADGSFAACARRMGATLGLGHTAATAAEAKEAIGRGVTSFTHLFNAMPPLHHREGGAVCTALTSDGCWVEMIADGLHVSPDMVKFAYRNKPKGKFVLITDSMEATGCPDGNYSIAGMPVVVRNGRAETLEGNLAGSTLRLFDGVKNLMKFAGIPLGEAIACATVNPAEMVGIDGTVGAVEPGKRADMILVDGDLNLVSVYASGEPVG